MISCRILCFLSSILVILNSRVVSQDVNQIILKDGQFKNILVAIHEGVEENLTIIDNIKNMFKSGSPVLFSATEFRAFWKEILILVPRSWTRKPFYEIAQSQSYNRANVRIHFGDESTDPKVVNHLSCGKEGNNLAMTTGYVQSGTCHKMDIVRNWARLRWSLMPEHYTGDDSSEPNYIHNGKCEGTRCSRDLSGILADRDAEVCQKNHEGKCPEDCTFQDVRCPDGSCSSLLFGSHCEEKIMKFCNKKDHNLQAPNLQNKKCGKSAWEVLYDSEDFQNENNPSMPPGTNTEPSFRILQPPSTRRVVLVLDISGSMNIENRFNKLIQAATIFIMDLVPAGSEVGLVSFHSYAESHADLREIRDGDSSREDLVKLLPSSTGGSTCIGCGIIEAIDMLVNFGGGSFGNYIFLLSDGEENVHPYIDDILQDIKAAGVVIDTLAIAQQADDQMEDLALNITGGHPFFCNDLRSSACVTEALLWTIVERPHLNIAQTPNVVMIDDFEVPSQYDSPITTVLIDAEGGNDTMVAVTWLDFLDMKVILEGPNGELIDRLHYSYTVDDTTGIITIRIPLASPGNWTIKMIHQQVSNETVGLTVTTKPRQKDAETVDAHVILSARSIDFTKDPKLGIYAIVKKGHSVVKHADVEAVVENTLGSITTTIALKDHGTGSDFMEGDGVYSGFFLDFDDNGRYSVTVNVLGTSPKVPYSTRKRRAVTPTPRSDSYPFMRSASGGVFVVDNFTPNAPDILSPSRIQDLAYSSFSYENASVVLTWTAVGDDLDQGTASEYELRYSNDIDFLRSNFTESPLVIEQQILDGNLSWISPAGHSEILTILLPVLTGNLNYYFSIRALDGAGNKGAISNIVSVPIIEPLLVTPSVPFTNYTDSTTITAPSTERTPSQMFSDISTDELSTSLPGNTDYTSEGLWTTDAMTGPATSPVTRNKSLVTTDNTTSIPVSTYPANSSVSGTVQVETQEPKTSVERSTLSWTTNTRTTTDNDSLNTTQKTTSTHNYTDLPTRSAHSSVSGTIQVETRKPKTSLESGTQSHSVSTMSKHPITVTTDNTTSIPVSTYPANRGTYSSVSGTVQVETQEPKTSVERSTLSWTTNTRTTTDNDSLNTTQKTTSTPNSTDLPTRSAHSSVSGTIQVETRKPKTSLESGTQSHSVSTMSKHPITASTSLADVSSTNYLLSTSNPSHTEPRVKTDSTLSSTEGREGSYPTDPVVGETPDPTVVDTESTLLTSTKGYEVPDTTERQETDNPADHGPALAISMTIILVAFGGTLGAAFGVAYYKKKQARIRPRDDAADSYQSENNNSLEFLNNDNSSEYSQA
ncbi:calcium-activated chloride channel regulator 1-like [Lytechinus pictus]|uniref:calcium-activated chloride channel regulator 1-like n=1 Tax=Lytechinus pictus TaxID=7653 RepID=UPI0030BA1BA4